MNKGLQKITRYFQVYGFSRTLIKVAGRTRKRYLRYWFVKLQFRSRKNVSLIGCGQFGFSTISYFLLKQVGNCFLECYDIVPENQRSTASFWGYSEQPDTIKLISNNQCEIVFIASNHASHTAYAVEALNQNKLVYLEKPISVTYDQLRELLAAQKENPGNLFVGYNRPFSAAIRKLNGYIRDNKLPITLNCFIVGHFIEKDHWYRHPQEGTRICGNVGHWIDLAVNILYTRGVVPHTFSVDVSYSNPAESDDNISIALTTDYLDLINIVMTSRAEPFEGISEAIQFQSGTVIAKIDDFRRMDVWNDYRKRTYRFNPKDVGHKKAIYQPFDSEKRNFDEVKISTVIMLEIADMVRNGEKRRIINPADVLTGL
ncbi:MAG: Gfo/Idh/MocA family protein [Sediminibacterium sp.]